MTFQILELEASSFRGLEDFKLDLSKKSSWLLTGLNGSGKSAVGDILKIFQRIGRGEGKISSLFTPHDASVIKRDIINLRIKIKFKKHLYEYHFQAYSHDSIFLCLTERLFGDENELLRRNATEATLSKLPNKSKTKLAVSADSVHLSVAGDPNSYGGGPNLTEFRTALSKIFVLRPYPKLMSGQLEMGKVSSPYHFTNFLSEESKELGIWYMSLLAENPSSYQTISDYLLSILPDFESISTKSLAETARELIFNFQLEKNTSVSLTLENLSSGERIFVLSALLLAQQKHFGPIICFWDEPENYLAPTEISPTISVLRSVFDDRNVKKGGQFITASHNRHVAGSLPTDNILLLSRPNHKQSPQVISASDILADKENPIESDFILDLLNGKL